MIEILIGILIDDLKCYERKYEPFDLYLLSGLRKKISYCQFSCHGFISQCQKCDKTAPNLLGNGHEFCQGRDVNEIVFHTRAKWQFLLIKVDFFQSEGEKNR